VTAPSRIAVGRSVVRVDAREKVTGTAEYCPDLMLPGTVHGVAARSTQPHARLRAIDASAALALPGVLAVITRDDLPRLPRFSNRIDDRPVLATDRVRYAGEPIALVVAETAAVARDAVRLVEVEYDPLPALMTAAEALHPDAAPMHDEPYIAQSGEFPDESWDFGEGKHPNAFYERVHGWGDPDVAFSDPDMVVVGGSFKWPMLYGYAMEPYNAMARFAGDQLSLWSSTQSPYQVRDELASIFGLPRANVRVAVPYLGGGYGTKSFTKVEPLAALGAWFTGRPVRVNLTVEETILTSRGDTAVIDARTAFTADGMLVAREYDITIAAGGYAGMSPLICEKLADRCSGPYRIPHLRVRTRAVYTNTAPTGALRGFGGPPATFSGESMIDMGADALGIDPVELRLRNLADRGEVFHPGKRALDSDLKGDLEMLARELGWPEAQGRAPNKGIGFAVAATNVGHANPAVTVLIRLLPDGTCTLSSAAVEMGQGSRTTLGQIAAEELGIEPERVVVTLPDTALAGFDKYTAASATTTFNGLAIQRAAADARRQARMLAADAFNVPLDEVHDAPGGVIAGGSVHGFGEVIHSWFGSAAGEIIGFGAVRGRDELEALPPFWEVGVTGVEVEVDPVSCAITVTKLVTIGDPGFAINPKLVEGQELGAALCGIGACLSEELIYEDGQLINGTLLDYTVPRFTDWPEVVVSRLAERQDAVGPYGSRGAGEGAANPVGSAISSAVARATGVRLTKMPIKAEELWLAIQRQQATVQTAGER
jgi:CO/xanthine dehydrogenase Mo-binding subunit